ncbi:hypothetical protein [Micromonospora sp. DT47]|uniref:hypothetical protein n=1 Tax=Micromonospora sp. DT47 TaxID=3393431 RepID=UPI003CF4F4D0
MTVAFPRAVRARDPRGRPPRRAPGDQRGGGHPGRGQREVAGQLDRWLTVHLALRLAAQVSGVVEVVDALGYAVDDAPLAALRAATTTPAGIA